MAAVTFGSRPIGLVAMIFLARLLSPSDFGVVALVLLLFSTTKLFSGLGMRAAVIHSKQDKGKIAFQAFVTTVLVSSILFLVVFSNAPFFAGLLGTPEATPLIRWLSVLIIIEALTQIPKALMEKELMFGQVSRSILASEVTYNGAAVALALLGFGLWSLVYARLASSLTKLLVMWVSSPGWDWLIPKKWDWGAMKELLRYGIQSTGSGFMSFFNSNADDWLVGMVLGPASLGLYSKAYNLTNRSISGPTQTVVNSVLFPSFSKIQDEKERLSRFYIKGLGIAALAVVPISLGALILADELVLVVLGEQWVPMVPAFRIFSVMALVRAIAGTTSPLFQAVGRPDFNFRVGLVMTAIMAPLIFLLLDIGIAGVAVAVTVAYSVGLLFNIYQVHKVLPRTASRMMPAILPAAVAGCTMMLGVQLSKAPLQGLIGRQADPLSVALMVSLGALIYIVTALVLRRRLILEAGSLMLDALAKGKRSIDLKGSKVRT